MSAEQRLADAAGPVRVGPKSSELDRQLARALEELLAHPHAEADADDSNWPIVVEAFAWMAIAAVVWLSLALVLWR